MAAISNRQPTAIVLQSIRFMGADYTSVCVRAECPALSGGSAKREGLTKHFDFPIPPFLESAVSNRGGT